MTSRELVSYFQDRVSGFIESTRLICEIESPSFDEPGSREVVNFLEAEFRQLKCVDAVERVSVPGVGEHLIIRAFQGLAGKPALLLGHTDTVHPRGSLAERPFTIDGDRIFAPGIFDMKSNCIMMLEIFRAFEQFEITPSTPIVILLSCDEEVGSQTGRSLVEREAREATFCLVCEPSANGSVKTGRKGTANYVFRVHGRPSHAGLEPEKGASSILEIARQIPVIQSLADTPNGTTVNVCLIKGGTATNVIPEFAECTIDVRFTRMAEAARVDRELRALQPFDLRVSMVLDGELNRPPLERTADVDRLYARAAAVGESFGYEVGETQVGGASDGNFVAALGVPVLDGLGIKGDGAHTNFEHILASDIPFRSALVAGLLANL